jgi:hypothetical protein
MTKYYHYIIENIRTGERREIIVKNKRPYPIDGYKYIGCCGYHEKSDDKRADGMEE